MTDPNKNQGSPVTEMLGRILCLIGLHRWITQAEVTIEDSTVFTSCLTKYKLKRCSRCGCWNIDPRGLGIEFDESGIVTAPHKILERRK
jgi:hypothetical protein